MPQQAELEKIVSFMTSTGYLVVEFPREFLTSSLCEKKIFNFFYQNFLKVKETTNHPHGDLIPKIMDTTNGCKTMTLKLSFPDNVDQTKIWLFIKDRDLIVKTEDMSQKHHTHARFFYYKRAILPENTDFDLLKCTFENNKLVVTAPLKTEYKSFRSVPLEFKKQY